MTNATPATAHPPTDWAEGEVEIDGRSVHYHSAGHGAVLLALDDGREPSVTTLPVFAQLADDHRVVVLALMSDTVETGSHRELGAAIAAFAAAIEIGSAAVLACGEGATAALWAAIDNPGLISTLVLEAPTVFGDATPADAQLVDALAACEVPTLILLGQLDPVASPRFAADYKRLPASSVAIVYAAGADTKRERPDAFVDTVSDYLRRGQAFVLSDASTLIHA